MEERQCSAVITLNGWSYRCQKRGENHDWHWWDHLQVGQAGLTPVKRIKWSNDILWRLWIDDGCIEFGPQAS